MTSRFTDGSQTSTHPRFCCATTLAGPQWKAPRAPRLPPWLYEGDGYRRIESAAKRTQSM